MTTLFFDGSFDGLLCAAFELYERKLGGVRLLKGEWREDALFEDAINIITDDKRAARVLKGLRGRLSSIGLHRLYAAYLAEADGAENVLLGYIRHVFDTPHNVEEDYGNKYVMRVSEMVCQVRREKYRVEKSIKFQQLSNGMHYITLEPAFNLLPLLIKHFKNRYADRKWIIYDALRNYGLYYDLHDTCFVALCFSYGFPSDNIIATFGPEEVIYQRLWAANIRKAHLTEGSEANLYLAPSKTNYWKHLKEKI